MSITGWPDSPPTRAGTAIGDILSALYTCIGILSALQVREKTGEGQSVDVALVDSVYASLENIPQKVFVEGNGSRAHREQVRVHLPLRQLRGPGRLGHHRDRERRDLEDASWRASELKELDDPTFDTNPSRVANTTSPSRTQSKDWVSARSVEEVVTTLNESGVPSCPIYDLKQASEDPHIGGARGMTVEREQPGLGPVTLLGNPIKMSATDPGPRGPAPELGGGHGLGPGESAGPIPEGDR